MSVTSQMGGSWRVNAWRRCRVRQCVQAGGVLSFVFEGKRLRSCLQYETSGIGS
jgi:hypothetical protein